jgi:GTPase involved in cell partitioning and DNA repair
MKVRVCGVKWIRAINWTASVIHVADADHIHSDYVRATEIVEIDLPELSADEVLAQVDEIVLTNKAAKLAALQAEIKLLKGE